VTHVYVKKPKYILREYSSSTMWEWPTIEVTEYSFVRTILFMRQSTRVYAFDPYQDWTKTKCWKYLPRGDTVPSLFWRSTTPHPRLP